MKLNFKQNINNKLNCDVFTTIRRSDSSDIIGAHVEIYLQNVKVFIGKIECQYKLKFKDIPYEVLMVDTGLILPTISSYLEVFKTWYPDWTMNTIVDIIIIKHDKIN